MLGAWPDTETLVLAFAERERTDQLLTKSPSSSARAPLAPAPRAMREATAAAATTKRRGMITPTAARKDTASGSATFPRRRRPGKVCRVKRLDVRPLGCD